MKRKYKIAFTVTFFLSIAYLSYRLIITSNPNPNFYVGQKLDSLNGVYVYYNGGVDHTGKRNLSEDGYNIGLTYQCVEFAKRYYYQFYKHKMPDAYGHAKDFFDNEVKDGKINTKRDLLQFTNGSILMLHIGDLVIFNGHAGNKYGHVAIISNVKDNEVEIVQQNPGPFSSSRARYSLKFTNKKYYIDHERVLGWLRIKNN